MRVDIGDGVRLFVDIDGQGLVTDHTSMRARPTLVLLHGGPGMDHTFFKGSGLDQLTDVAQVVYLDHRGEGRSDRCTPQDWTLDTWADDIVRLCDTLEITRPVVLGGSFGGMVAQRYLARHPEHPGKVILAATMARLDLDRLESSFGRLGGPEIGSIARRYFAGDRSLADEFDQRCLPLYSSRALDIDRFARITSNTDMSAHFNAELNRMDLRDGLANAVCPVLVIAGELDPICPIDAAEEIVAHLPPEFVRFERLDGAAHMEAAADAIAPLVRQFIVT